MRSANTRKVLLVAALLLLSLSQSAYVVRTLINLTRTRWQVEDFPVTVEIWQGLTDTHASLADGSNPLGALKEAVERWARVSSMTIVVKTGSSSSSIGKDGVNLVTIADTSANRNVVGEALGVSQTWQQGSRIIESDVIINPKYSWSTRENDGAWNILQTALHEFGHSGGLGHSINRSSAMYYQGGTFDYGFNRLTWDDVAGINSTYSLVGMDYITGTVSGRITLNGSAVYGGFVVAVDEDGVLMASALSMPDGSYQLENLPPGRYTLYAEPLDGPTTPGNVSLGQLPTNTMFTTFRPQFYNNSSTPTVQVRMGQATSANFAVMTGKSQVDPQWARIDDNPNQSGQFSALSVYSNQGTSRHFAVAGDGVATLSDDSGVFFLGPHIQTGRVSRTARNTGGIDFKWFPLDIPVNAPRGSYTAFLKGNGETGVITGALDVYSPFRFIQAFGHFAHFGRTVSSEVFLINTQPGRPVTGKIYGLNDTGAGALAALTPLAKSAPGEFEYALNPGGALSVRSGGDSDFRGSLRNESTSPLAGTVLIETEAGTTSVVPSLPMYSFLAPVEVELAGGSANTGLAITNLDNRPAQVFVQVHNASGVSLGSQVLDLKGNGQTSQFVPEMVAGLPSSFKGTVRVTSNREIGATVIRTSPGVFTTFPVVENRVTTRNLFAQFAHGGDLSSELLLVNPSPLLTARQVSVRVRNTQGQGDRVYLNGELLPGGVKNVSIPPQGLVSLRTTGTASLVGSVEVVSDVPVGGVVLFRSAQGGTTGVGESTPARRLVMPLDRNLAVGRDTGIAVVNGNSRPVNVTLTVRDANGNVLSGPYQLPLGPWQQLARFPGDAPLNLNVADEFKGSLWVESDGEVALTVIRQAPGVLTTFPALSLEEYFTPNY